MAGICLSVAACAAEEIKPGRLKVEEQVRKVEAKVPALARLASAELKKAKVHPPDVAGVGYYAQIDCVVDGENWAIKLGLSDFWCYATSSKEAFRRFQSRELHLATIPALRAELPEAFREIYRMAGSFPSSAKETPGAVQAILASGPL